MRPAYTVVLSALISLSGLCALAAPEYLIDARGWDGRETARIVVRAVPALMLLDAWTGGVSVEGGELLDVRVRSREGRAATPGVTLTGADFAVDSGQPMHDLVIELNGRADTRVTLRLGDATVGATIGELLADDRDFALPGGANARLLLTFVYPSERPEPIRRLKPILSATELMVGGAARCVIAAPADGRYREQADRAQAALAAHGSAPRVIAAEELMNGRLQPNSEALAAANVIAIGTVLDNRLAGGLWGRGQAMASQLYPGPGGHVIRTIHDPFGLGRNVLLLAGSDAAGVEQAVTRFLEAYVPAQGDVVLPAPVVDVRCIWVPHAGIPDAWPKRMPQVRDMAYLRQRCVEAGVMDDAGEVLQLQGDPNATVTAVVSALTVLGETWWYLGWEQLPPMMGEVLERNVAAFEQYQARPPHEMSSGITAFADIWDLLEELPVFSDRARLAVTNALLAQARQGHEPRAMHALVREGCRQVHDENHGTNSALNDLVPWSYFALYYDLPDTAYWLTMVDALFRGQASSFQVAEDAAGYNTSCPDHAMIHAYSRPDLGYLERGVARHICDYFLSAGVNNLGLLTGFGDTSGLVPVGYFNVFARAEWYYRDGRYRWAIENLLHRNSGLRAYMDRIALRDDITPIEPVDLTGIVIEPIYERLVEKGGGRLEPIYLPEEPTGDGSFNKAALREAWAADKQYLLLSGMQRDGHTQAHVNAVINLTDNGKMWLVDHEYGLRLAADHSGIIGMRDGTFINPGRQARVTSAADFEHAGLLNSRVGLGSLTWDRTLVWLKGDWYAVLDSLTAEQAGEYVLRASWRGLGAETPAADRMQLAQQEQRYEVITDGEGSLDLQVVPFAGDDEWKAFYPGVDPAAKVLRQDKVLDLQTGQAAHFATLLAGYPADAGMPADVATLSDGAAVITVGERRWLIAGGPVSAEGIAFAGAQALLGSDLIALCSATALSVGGEQLLQAAEPVSLQVDLQSGRVTMATGAENASLTWRGGAVTAGPGDAAVTVDVAGLGDAIGRMLTDLGAAASERKQRSLAGGAGGGYDGLVAVGGVDLGAPVTRLVALGDAVAAGLADGSVVVVGDDDALLWRWQGGGSITALAAADLDGDGAAEVIAGTQDGLVYAIDGGDVLWQFEVRGSDTASYRYAKALVPADLEGDGRPEILVVAPFLHCLGSDGTQAWEEYLAHWRNMWRTNCGAVDAADLDGDGQLEVISSWIDGYSGTRVLRADGEPVAPVSPGDDFSPKVNHGKPAGVLGLDFNGDGRGDVAVGYDGGIVTFPYDTQERFGVGVLSVGPVLHLLAGRSPEHDPLLIATNDMADVRAAYHRMEDADAPYRLRQAWRVSVGAPITAAIVADLDGDGFTETIVGTRRGSIVVISSTGEIMAKADGTGAAVSSLCVSGGAEARIVVGRGDGRIERLRLAR